VAQLGVKLLGRMTCELPGGQQLNLSTRKSEALMAYLAMSPGLHHSRERLVNLFWSDRGEDQARNSLRQALSSLKKTLDVELPELFEVERTTVRLKADNISVDVDAFRLLASESDIDKLVEATQIYTGEFLEGMVIRDPAGEQWLAEERDNLKRIYVDVLGRLSQLQLDNTDYRSAINSAERLVSTDPLEESGWRLLMKANHRNGNRNHALMAYKRCCDVLQKELGVEPEGGTSELQQQIISGQVKTRQPAIAEKQSDSARNATESTTREHSILVLPFKNLSDDPEQQYFSDGLTEGIIMGLSLFPSLRVHSRNSSFAASAHNLSIREIGETFDAHFVVEGSVRKSQDKVRITAQLVNTETGEQVWGQRFDNNIEETLSLEDQVTRSIVSIIKGRIELAELENAHRKPAKNMQSYDLLMRGRYHLIRFNPKDNRIAIEYLLKCIEIDPDNAAARNNLYRCYGLDWLSAWTEPRSECLDKARFQISKAMELEPDSSFIRASYAEYLIFAGEFEQAELHLDRAIKLNPNDTEAIATISAAQASLGHIESALDLADTCRRLDPFHPWVDWVTGIAYYRGKRYEDALKAFRNMPNPADEIDGWIAACYQRLGEHDKASRHLNSYLEIAHKNMAKFPESLEEWKQIWSSAASFRHQEDVDYPFEALCEIGLADFTGTPDKLAEVEDSHNIAVLPFDNLSGDPEQEYFSDGITESIIINLSLFPGLLVKSRNSSFAFKQQIKSLGEISQELNVDYVVEGSIRKSDDRIRITVQLIEAQSGNQIWGNRYECDLSNLFVLEEELSRTIAATVTGQIESDLQRFAITRAAAHQDAYNLLLSGIYHCYKITRSDMVIAIEKLNQCILLDADNVRAHITLYTCHSINILERWVDDPEASFKLAGEHIEKALSLGPDMGIVQSAYAEYLVFCGNAKSALGYADRALKINPNDPEALTVKAFALEMLGEHKDALQLAELAQQLDPYHPWVDWNLTECQIFSEQYEEALTTISSANNAPGLLKIYSVVANIKLNRKDQAKEALKSLIQECRTSMLSMPTTCDEWIAYTKSYIPLEDSSINVDIVSCMVQAGLEDYLIPDSNGAIGSSEHVSSIAILPFDNLSGDPEQEYFSDGITESIILNLSLFPDLNVKSRNSSFAFKEQIKSLGEISKELNVDYVVEGSIRKANDRIRVTVQLIEAESGNQIWGKRQDSDLSNLFDLEEELSRTIAATVTGQIESDLQRIAISKSAADQQSYDLLLSGKYHCYKFTREDMIVSQEKLEKCLALDPTNVQAHALLYECHIVNWMERWIVDYEHAFKLAGDYIHKALKLDPEVVMVQIFYAEYLIFCRENEAAARCVEKVLSINPNNPDALATKAFNLNAIGEYELALETSKNCKQLDLCNPWVDWIIAEAQLFTGDPSEAIQTILNSKTSISYLKALLVVAYSQAGDEARAKETMQQFLRLCSDTMLSMPANRDEWIKYWSDNLPYRDTRMVDDLIACLMEAGLCDESEDQRNKIDEEGEPTILVLPFQNLSGDSEQEYFSDGISESLIVNLSSFSGLTVKSRHTSFVHKNSSKSIEEIVESLEVQYIVEGSIRKFENKVRITVQLSDTDSGNQLWGKRFESDLDSLFSIEEELVQTIAGTISGRIGREIKSASALKPANSLKSYDYLMRAWHHMEKFNPQDTVTAIEHLEKCIEIDPDNAEAHTLLATSHINSLYENWTDDREQTLSNVRKHMLKALDLEPNNALTHAFIVEYYLQLGDLKQAMFHAERSIELNPTLPEPYAIKAYIMGISGEKEEAIKYADIAMKIDPYHYYMGWSSSEAYMHVGEYTQAIEAARTVPHMPASLQAQVAGCLVALGQLEEARVEMEQFQQRAAEEMPNYPRNLDAWKKLWRQNTPVPKDEDFDAFFDLLIRAGLCDQFGEESDEMPSVLVLPFENISGDPEQAYFSHGITESIILTLSSSWGLTVKSRHTSFAYKDSTQSIREIGDELNVPYIVEGSIRKHQDQVRITVQLGESSTGNQIWGKRYDKPLDELFEVEEDLVRSIAGAISGRIGREVRIIASKKPASDMKSFDYLMRGWYYYEQHNPEALAKSIENHKKCIEIDPENVDAHAFIAGVSVDLLYENWCEDREQTRSEIEHYIHKALALDQNNAFTHAVMGDFSHSAGDNEKCHYHANRAIELDPTLPDGYSIKAISLITSGDIDKAVELADFSMQLDQFHNYTGWSAGEVYRAAGNYKKAIEAFSTIPNMPPCLHAQISTCLVGLGQLDKAKAEMAEYLRKAREFMPRVPTSQDAWRSLWSENINFQIDKDFDVFFDQLLQAGLCDDMVEATDQVPSIAVLPFENMSGDPEQEYFSNGISDSIISNLASFPGLNVKSRSASFAYKGTTKTFADIASELEIQYIIEGSIRKSGDKVRISVQLSDAESGNQLWGKRFESRLEDLFSIEEELVQTIAGTISGRIGKDLKSASMHKPAKDLKSYDYLMRGIYHLEKFNARDNQIAQQEFKKCLEHDPDNPDAHSYLAGSYSTDIYDNWSKDPKDTKRLMMVHAEKALELEPDNALAHAFMGEALMMHREFERAEVHVDRAIELNPTLPDGYSIKCYVMGSTRRYAEAIENADISVKIDPHHPYMAWNAGEVYRICGQYDRAVKTFHSMSNSPPSVYAQTAAAFAALGKIDEAKSEMNRYLDSARTNMPKFPKSEKEWRRVWYDTMPYQYEEDAETLFELLLKAGLCDYLEKTDNKIPRIAVLPFENMSGDPEQDYFSDGVTTSIILGLGLFKGLSVKSRQSSFVYRASEKPSEEIARDLLVDYLVEGSVRKSKQRVRVTVQLVDADSGSQIWGKQYDEKLDDIFELEQELSQTIASTISGRIGDTLQQSAARKSAKNLESYDYLLRGFYYLGRLNAGDQKTARQQFEKCLEIDPENATAHTNLGMVHLVDIIENWTSDVEESTRLADHHIEIALKLEPDNAQAHAYMAEHLFYLRDFERSEFHANKAIELNPMMSEAYAVKADLLGFTRRVDEAVECADKCIQLDPHSPGAGWVVGAIYRKAGLYQKAIKTFRSISHPPASVHALISVCFAHMELQQESEKEMQRYLELANQQMPVFPANEDDWRKLWRNNMPYQYDEDFDEFFDLLVQAGLLKMAEVTANEVPSIAVLPFENMSVDPEQEHFADGITTDIIATLSKFKHMRTVSRYSILKYKTEKTSIDAIAAEQDVRYILEGSVRRSGKRIRVSAELIDSQSHDAVWSERYDRNLDDLFAVQDEIAQSIALALKVHLDDGDMAIHRSTGTSNVKAWELVLTAVDLQDTYIRKNILDARSLTTEATRLDPNYPFAWVSLGWTYWQEIYAGWGSDSMDELLAEAEHACQKAFDISPDYSEAWSLWGLIHLMKHEPEQALKACRRAVELEPGNAEIHALAAFVYLFVHDFEQARKHNQIMLKLCPVLPNWYYLLEGEMHRLEGNPGESVQFYRKGIDVEPESPLCRFYLIDALMEIGDITNAQILADEIRALDSSVNGKGLVQTFSENEAIRESFRANLAYFELV